MELSPLAERFILHWGEMGSRRGVNRTVAQIHALHEADLDPVSNQKQSITRAETTDIADFLLALGNRICDLVV